MVIIPLWASAVASPNVEHHWGIKIQKFKLSRTLLFIALFIAAMKFFLFLLDYNYYVFKIFF